MPELAATTVSGRVTRYLYDLRTEGPGRGRHAAAVGLGIFIGCTPFFGAHFWICVAVGWALHLNRLKMYLAANISNPLLAPFIMFAEIQSGSYIRHGAPYPLTIAALRQIDPGHFAGDLLAGTLVVGSALGAIAAATTWILGRADVGPSEDDLISEAAGSYLVVGLSAWESANAKLRLDPVYREAIRHVAWPGEGRVLDLGCGRGLMLAMLAAYYDHRGPDARSRVRLHGVEYRSRMVRLGRRALGDRVTIEQADLTACPLPTCRVAMLFDVLHCLPEPEQEALLGRLRDAVEPGGSLVIREADAGGGSRFTAGQLFNRLVAVAQGRWGRRFHFRTAEGWVVLLARFGFIAEAAPQAQATPFANVLIRATRVV